MGSSVRSLGTALVTVGAAGAGILATIASASERTTSHWHEKGFLALFSLFCLLAAIGVYLLLSSLINWLPPRRASERGSDDSAAFETEGEGETEIVGGSVAGYERVSKTKDRGKFRSEDTDVKR